MVGGVNNSSQVTVPSQLQPVPARCVFREEEDF